MKNNTSRNSKEKYNMGNIIDFFGPCNIDYCDIHLFIRPHIDKQDDNTFISETLLKAYKNDDISYMNTMFLQRAYSKIHENKKHKTDDPSINVAYMLFKQYYKGYKYNLENKDIDSLIKICMVKLKEKESPDENDKRTALQAMVMYDIANILYVQDCERNNIPIDIRRTTMKYKSKVLTEYGYPVCDCNENLTKEFLMYAILDLY